MVEWLKFGRTSKIFSSYKNKKWIFFINIFINKSNIVFFLIEDLFLQIVDSDLFWNIPFLEFCNKFSPEVEEVVSS